MNTITLTEEETDFLQNMFYESGLYDWIPSIEQEDGSFAWDETSFEYLTFLKLGIVGETE
jgi:hypothetical protein